MAKRGSLSTRKDVDEQIIQHYKEGYSQKDIQKKLNVSLLRIRKLLSERGFTTQSYRAISPRTKDIIELLIYEGYSYFKISQILDISFYVIRDIIEIRVLRPEAKERFSLHQPLHDGEYERFLMRYEEGDSFLLLYEELKLGMQDITPLAKEIMEQELIVKHQQKLKKQIGLMLDEGLPIHTIAKKLQISVSVVKREKKRLESNL